MNRIIFGDCQNMCELEDDSVHLVVTSPPYFNRISRRSWFYYYPDNLRESILTFQNGDSD